MIFCTQFEPEGWYTRIASEDDTILSDAIVDRIIPNSYEIMIEGNITMRERHGIHQAQNNTELK